MYRYHLTKLYIYSKTNKHKSNQAHVQCSLEQSSAWAHSAGEDGCAVHHLGAMMENALNDHLMDFFLLSEISNFIFFTNKKPYRIINIPLVKRTGFDRNGVINRRPVRSE